MTGGRDAGCAFRGRPSPRGRPGAPGRRAGLAPPPSSSQIKRREVPGLPKGPGVGYRMEASRHRLRAANTEHPAPLPSRSDRPLRRNRRQGPAIGLRTSGPPPTHPPRLLGGSPAGVSEARQAPLLDVGPACRAGLAPPPLSASQVLGSFSSRLLAKGTATRGRETLEVVRMREAGAVGRQRGGRSGPRALGSQRGERDEPRPPWRKCASTAAAWVSRSRSSSVSTWVRCPGSSSLSFRPSVITSCLMPPSGRRHRRRCPGRPRPRKPTTSWR